MCPESVVPPTAHRRTLPALWFLLALVALGAIAIVSLRTPSRIVTGLPDDPVVEGVRARVRGRLGVETGELRFASALLGEGGPADPALAVDAEQTLRAARTRNALDPRRLALLACLDLAALRLGEAERVYGQALEIAPGYGEARLGLGVALALQAAEDRDRDRARGLRLRAISQFAAVPEADPVYEAALYNRVLLLARAGRADEARHRAHEYFARDSASTWAITLARVLGVAPR